jgi:hypothetical protein
MLLLEGYISNFTCAMYFFQSISRCTNYTILVECDESVENFFKGVVAKIKLPKIR